MVLGGLIKYIAGLLLLSLLIFLPAGTIAFKGGWLLIVSLFVPMFIFGVVLVVAAPELLAKRLNSKEKRDKQGAIVRLSGPHGCSR